ncbi:hypothetical protein LB566_14345 [Mesorhizobium sp. CA13]|uniref:hypothetical protein n=1 Tax=unclassified Mesorhizobium TaxID=325217 RepID=UPI001CCBEB06|nr:MULTISPECIES: hypothetical protein [unclassified Mesorhizobium]MBZ9854987.1 hypothetical protein [Mesorhizobium sp. CA13]MBZ9966063.1 hypothetical protein [Mesorhizobium sp. BR1-1-2]
MTEVTSVQAGSSLATIGYKLLEFGIIQNEGFSSISRVSQKLKGGKDSLRWLVEVDRSEPIIFEEALDSKGNIIVPTITCEGIQVDQRKDVDHPFSALDIAIEIGDDKKQPVARWHVDLANEDEKNGQIQSGPLFHLQYGGHQHGFRELDEKLKEPRWCHPPMDVALLCEVVAANFFPEKWAQLIQDQTWCKSIKVFERLCYTQYIEKLTHSLGRNDSTALGCMWALHWR